MTAALDPARLAGRRPERSSAPHVMLVLPGLGAGGSERIVSALANGWASRGWQVTVATFAAAADPSYYPYHPRVALRRLGLPPAPAGPVRAVTGSIARAVALRRLLRRQRPDLAISFLTRTNVLTLLAGAGLSLPILVSERNNPAAQPTGRPWRAARWLLYPRAFGLVTMTRGALEHFPQRMRRRGWVIPNLADLPRGFNRRSDGRTLVAVGRLVPQKGFDLLLDAFAQAAPQHPGWRLVIWGEGPERGDLLARRDRLGLADRVSLPGVSDVPGGWLEQADAFVLSSRYEGWGIVLLEAMAAGLPTVSFDCRWGPAEMVEHGVDGLLVPDGDVPALAAAIGRIMGDAALRQRLGAAARHTAQRFSPDRILALWDEVADRMLAGRRDTAGGGRVAVPLASG